MHYTSIFNPLIYYQANMIQQLLRSDSNVLDSFLALSFLGFYLFSSSIIEALNYNIQSENHLVPANFCTLQ